MSRFKKAKKLPLIFRQTNLFMYLPQIANSTTTKNILLYDEIVQISKWELVKNVFFILWLQSSKIQFRVQTNPRQIQYSSSLSGKFCRVTKTQDLTMMTQQHERHFKPRISKEVSLTLRLLEKKSVPTRVCRDELVKIFKAYYQIYIEVGTYYKSGYCIETHVLVISHFTRGIRKGQHVDCRMKNAQNSTY